MLMEGRWADQTSGSTVREGQRYLPWKCPGDPLTTLWGQLRHLVPFGPTGGLSTVLGAHLLAAHGAELGSSCSRFLGSQKNCSFRGSSFTSTGIASYSSLSMLKEPPVPCEEESVQLTPPWQSPVSTRASHSSSEDLV